MPHNLPKNEAERLGALRAYEILDTPPESRFDDLARLAATVCDTPTALVSFTDENRQWFKSRVNFEAFELPREIAFCAHVVLDAEDVLIVEDASADTRFAANPLVAGNPHIRFYAGVPLVSPDGFTLGALCVIDYKPRRLSAEQIASLKLLAKQVVSQMEQRREIAEREKTEKKLVASEQRFRDYLDNSLALFCTHDLDGVILSVNPAAAKSLGYSQEEIIGKHLNEFIVPEARTYTAAYLMKIEREGSSHGLMWVLTKSGERRIWSHSNILRTDADGGRGGKYVLGSAQDVTDLKNNEQELDKSRRMFQSFMNNSPAVIFLKDEAGKFAYINEPFESLFNVSSEDLLGKTETFFTTKEIADAVQANDAQVLKTEKPLQTVELVPTPDGETHHWLSHKFLIKDEAGKKFVGGIAVDITERRRMEIELREAHDAALESARLKSAFLTNVSHEIRTPMNGVIGMTELLLDTPLDRAQRDCAETIRQSADALLTVINDILDLAKIESGKLRFETVDFDPREVVESTVEMLAERTFRKNIEIASLVAADIPQVLRGDPGRLRQVLTNLVGNAVKFTERGEIGVLVKTERETARDLVLRFTITDTGIGIGEKDIKNLFQPFVQVDNSTTRQYGGTGLGLVISKQIVEMMDGEITVESQPGRGSQFSFTACFNKSVNSVSSTEGANNTSSSGAYQSFAQTESGTGARLLELLAGKRVLIADASPIIRRTLKEYGAVWQLETAEAASGEEALSKLREAARADGEKPFDVVLIDINLPDWEGFALTKRIKSDSTLKDARVILTTAYGQRGDAARAQEIGVAAYLTKPIRGTQFFDCLVAVLSAGGSKLSDEEKNSAPSSPPLVTRHSLREAKSQIEIAPVRFDEKSFPILVAEDNEINRRLVLKQLEQIGVFHVDTAIDGQDALEKIGAKDYRLIFMDCQMPRLDGYEATREIRRRERAESDKNDDETFAPAVVIALTAHTLAGEREKCLAAGMNDYIAKPIKIKELAAMLNYWSQASGANKTNETKNVEPARQKTYGQSVPSQANFDPQPLRQLADNSDDADFADEIFRLYLEETAKRIEELKRSADGGDVISVARAAHTIRGNSLAVGANSVARLTEQIERLSRENKLDQIHRLLPELARAFDEINTELFAISERS